MKTRLLTVATLLALLSFLAPVCGFAEDDDDDSPVGKEMGVINRSLKKLSRQYADPAQKNSSLELVAKIQEAVEKSKTLTPAKAEKAPDKAKFMATYKKDLDELGKELVLLKDALSADKADAAKAELDKIGKLKMSSHKEMGVGAKRRGEPGAPAAGAQAEQPTASPAPAASPSPVQ